MGDTLVRMSGITIIKSDQLRRKSVWKRAYRLMEYGIQSAKKR